MRSTNLRRSASLFTHEFESETLQYNFWELNNGELAIQDLGKPIFHRSV